MRPSGKSPEGPPFPVDCSQNLQPKERPMQQMDSMPPPLYSHGQAGPIRPPPVPPGRGMLPGRGYGRGRGPPEAHWGRSDFEFWAKRPRMDGPRGHMGWGAPGVLAHPPDLPPPPDWHHGPRPTRGSMTSGAPYGFHPHDRFEPPMAHSLGPGPPIRAANVENRRPPPPPGWARQRGTDDMTVGNHSEWVGKGELSGGRPRERGGEGRGGGADWIPERPGGTWGWNRAEDPYDRQKVASETRVKHQLEKIDVSPELSTKSVYEKYLKASGKGPEDLPGKTSLNPDEFYLGDYLRDDNAFPLSLEYPYCEGGSELLKACTNRTRAWQTSKNAVKTSRSLFTVDDEQMRVLQKYCKEQAGSLDE